MRVYAEDFLEQRVAVGKLLANTKATKPTMAPLPLVNSASGLNGPKVLPGAVTPSGLDFFNTGANEAAKMTTAQNGAKNKPAPGYVTVSETPSANVNVLVENTCPHKDLFWVISVYKAAIQPICATRPLIISIAVGFVNTFMASSRSCVSFPSGAASATEPSAGSLFYERDKNMFGEIRVERSEIGQSFEEYIDE